MPLDGARIRELMDQKEMTPGDLTKQLLIGTATLWRWKSGRNEPSAAHLQQLAAILDTNVGFLLGETDDPTPPKQEVMELTPMERKLLDAYRRGGDKGVFRLLLGDDD